ncbi:MAG: NAD+ synthase [candidate division Zixibacteria bacterium RBG_16_50_21]|nr:MAG: NAD+ synthase [candidate division Zixibacteria bacterium RBG_16_50_21]
MRPFRLALAQINCTVGDLTGNVKKIKQFIQKAKTWEADLVAFPELAVTGYPPEDLLLKSSFIQDNLKALNQVVKSTVGITAVVGFVDKNSDIYNAAALIHNRKLAGVYYKKFLPNYGVFDEYRYFKEGKEFPVYLIRGAKIGINICEDIWYPEGPAYYQATYGGAELIININASPYHLGKWKTREKMLSTRAFDNELYVAYVNLVGGQDELVFDGHSMVFEPGGKLKASGKQFEEDLIILDLDLDAALKTRLHDPRARRESPEAGEEEKLVNLKTIAEQSPSMKKRELPAPQIMRPNPVKEIYDALVLGTGDYVRKNGFKKVVIGLSGGIDSALVAAIAADALGKENVVGVFMPSEFTAKSSFEDAGVLAKNLGIQQLEIPIGPLYHTYLKDLEKTFKGRKFDITEENIQARIRGNILMALSNKFGWLVLTTGNKSELACGYATLYGDMAGGFAVIKDIFKTMVYKLARYRNEKGRRKILTDSLLKKPPSAELRKDQKDTDALPPYEILDPILKAYVEEDQSPEEIVKLGYNLKLVNRVITMVDRSEYKRRQAPPGVKVTARAFGKDRRLPITNRYLPW